MSEIRARGETDMKLEHIQVIKLAELDFATGKVGLRHPLVGEAAETAHARELAGCTTRLTQTNTAFCGDERLTVRLADGTDDPVIIRQRVVPQLFGGLGLATSKALAAADAGLMRGAKSLKDAYENHVIPVFDSLPAPEEDAAHDDCGAAKAARSSVENARPIETLLPAYKLFLSDWPEERILKAARQNDVQKKRLLEQGFYEDFDPQWHKDFVISRRPQNFSYLLMDPSDHETRGHNGSSVYVITKPGHGFRKNGKAFCVTLPKMHDMARKLGGSDEERDRILLAYIDDTLNVGAGLVRPRMPVFAETA